MPVGASIAAASAVGAGASIYGANKASKAAKSAANQNNALQKEIYDRNTANMQPWMDRGNQAGGVLNGLLGLGDQQASTEAFNRFLASTPYQFQLGEGLKAVNQNYATRGALNSGAALKALNNYAQGQAQSALGTYMSSLGGISAQGMQGASALAGYGQNYANQVGQNNNNAAAASGNAALASAGQIGNLASNLAGTYALQNAGAFQQSSYGAKPTPFSGNYGYQGANMGGLY